ncbi:alpha/beta hydrolase [Sporolactobacillus sp. CPB3-1]|uniref:Alpha/beta hydrolase n=1 Tax=Sporolactobacillus mangiferae TaxID=2940498 RepID=A0ABT0M9E1_9BACL|nr:alpha/beta family hydrolase [Sporolactobacillus mangiferae]MCL1631492.1 alpha/beta hydrolase [Sporolactobacillus mangiferae]
MKTIEEKVKGKEHAIAYTHVETESNAVCFMFAGIGYTYDRPLLYYATMMMLQHEIDVVQVHYHYGRKMLKQPFDARVKIMMDDIQPVIDAVLADHPYTRFVFLGKSIGTIPIAGELIRRKAWLNATFLLLTPLLTHDRLFTHLLNAEHPGLLVIGDHDRFYDVERVSRLKETQWNVCVIPGADHSLNIGFDTDASLSALANVMKSIEHVINQG